jgi:asparagine synthase (glutamine-hydrolysing)
MGVKPLYYWWDERTFVFASEIKSLLQHPSIEKKPQLPAIAEYMSAMYTTGDQTWFAGVRRLLPGHFVLVSPQGAKLRQWWDVPASEEPPGRRPERYYIHRTRELLEDSVRLRLRSDVPLGAHLSGGLDSSAIVALLSGQRKALGESVRTFSGAFAEGAAYDERRYIRAVVKMYGTHHRETVPTAADLPRLMDRMIWHMDEPAAGPGILLQWAVCELSRREGVTVINGGQGGDEAWGGYFGYIPAYLRTVLRQARRKPDLFPQFLRNGGILLSRPATRKSLLNALKGGRSGRLRPGSDIGEWAGELFEGVQQAQPQVVRRRRSPLDAATYWDLKWYLPALLQVEDRTSMAFALESRAPLLDYRLIEHAASVPSALKLKNLEMKHILREAIKNLLPSVVYRRTDKMGMPTPISLWFRESLAGWVREQLLSEASLSCGLLSREYVEQAIEEHRAGKADRSLDVWKMLNLVAWWRVYMEGHDSYSEVAELPDRQAVTIP